MTGRSWKRIKGWPSLLYGTTAQHCAHHSGTFDEFYNCLKSAYDYRKNSSNHGSLILKKSIFPSFDEFFRNNCKRGKIVKFVKTTTVNTYFEFTACLCIGTLSRRDMSRDFIAIILFFQILFLSDPLLCYGHQGDGHKEKSSWPGFVFLLALGCYCT